MHEQERHCRAVNTVALPIEPASGDQQELPCPLRVTVAKKVWQSLGGLPIAPCVLVEFDDPLLDSVAPCRLQLRLRVDIANGIDFNPNSSAIVGGSRENRSPTAREGIEDNIAYVGVSSNNSLSTGDGKHRVVRANSSPTPTCTLILASC